jgi:hypothetical protein
LAFRTVCKLELDVVALFNSAVTVIFSLKQGKWLAISFIKERNIVTTGTQLLAQL